MDSKEGLPDEGLDSDGERSPSNTTLVTESVKPSDDEVKSTKTLTKMHNKEELPDELLDFYDGQKPSPAALVTESKVKSHKKLKKTERWGDLPEDRLDSGDGHRPSPTPSGVLDTSFKPNIKSNDKLPNELPDSGHLCKTSPTPKAIVSKCAQPFNIEVKNPSTYETRGSNKEVQDCDYDKNKLSSPSDLLSIYFKPSKVTVKFCPNNAEDRQQGTSD